MPRVSPQSLLAPRSFNVLTASLDSARLFVHNIANRRLDADKDGIACEKQ